MAKLLPNKIRKHKKIQKKTNLAIKAIRTHVKACKDKNLNDLVDNELVTVVSSSTLKLRKNKVKNGSTTNATDVRILVQLAENYVPKPNFLIVDDSESWIAQLTVEIKEIKPTPMEVREKLKEAAAYFYEHDVKMQRSRENESSSSSSNLRKIVLTHGTAKDVVSALASYCVDVPFHSLHELQRLITFVNPKRKIKSSKPIDYLGTLFRDTYLPDGHVAKEFECHAFTTLLPYVTKSPELIIKQLVLWYFEDQLRMCYLQLIENLSLLSNQEIGKIQSLAIAKLTKFISEHPKQDAAVTLPKIINKLGDKLRKVAAAAINQLRVLQETCPHLKDLLVSLIHGFIFREGIHQRSQFYGLCVLNDITLAKDDPLAEKMIKIYFQFFKTCIEKGSIDNRFMSALLRGINKASSKSKYDMLQKKRDTLYTMCYLVSFNRAVQVVQLIYQTYTGNVPDRYYNLIYKMLLLPEFANSSNICNFLNLLYKSMVNDTEQWRVQAFFKRMLQVSIYLPSDALCGILKVISQVLEENTYTKTISDTLCGKAGSDGKYNKKTIKSKRDEDLAEDDREYFRKAYDIKCVNPLYARADLAHIWELYVLQRHSHPSVAAFVSQMSMTAKVDYSGDPFVDFSTKSFLDRFVQKKPKKLKYEGNNVYARNKQYVPEGARNIPVHSKEFCETAVEDIPVDELFFYNYYKYYGKSTKKVIDDGDIDDDEFESIMRKKHFNEYVNPDLSEINFATSFKPIKESSGDIGMDMDTTEDSNDETYEEENEYMGNEEDLDDSEDEYEETDDEEEYSNFKEKTKAKAMNSDDMYSDAVNFSAMLKSNAKGNSKHKRSGKHSSANTPPRSASRKKRNGGDKSSTNRNLKRKRMTSKSNKINKRAKRNLG